MVQRTVMPDKGMSASSLPHPEGIQEYSGQIHKFIQLFGLFEDLWSMKEGT